MRATKERAKVSDREQVIPWDDAVTRSERRKLMAAAGMRGRQEDSPLLPAMLARLGAGPRGRTPGRVPWEAKIPMHHDSTAAAMGLYPWIPGRALPAFGPGIGRDAWSGNLWCWDPWQLRAAGLVGDTGLFLTGVIGSGKSALAKSMCMRHVGFGRSFVVPADIRGEWAPVVDAVGGKVMRLGPGMPDRLNCLAMPRQPAGVDDRDWWLTVRTHWEGLLGALAETRMRGSRILTPEEVTGIEAALTEAACYDSASGNLSRVKPIHLAAVVDLLLEPNEKMAATLHMPVSQLKEQLRGVGLALRQLTAGALQGLVDSDAPDNQIDPWATATCVDISRVRSSDASIAMVMACTQAVMELSFAFHPQQWWMVYDELWRLMRFGQLLARIDSSLRTSRGSGAAHMLISHRFTDSLMGDDVARQAAADLISNTGTKVVYKQRKDAQDITAGMLSLPDMAARELPKLRQARGLWVVDGKSFIVDHILSPDHGMRGVPTEFDVINTDQALADSYRSLVGRSEGELWSSAA